jgi:leucyl-tRNA synthetase
MIDMEKEGVFTGSYAINPITKEKIPVYAGNFVLADYGSGMVMGVPGHDQRDFEFAKKYKIEIKQVIEGKITNERAYTESGKLINSGNFSGISNEEAKNKITDFLIEKKLAKRVVNYKLRDWSVARQRYWGTPIPLIHCKKCGVVPVPEKDLPVVLPKEVKFGKGNPLLTNEKWLNVKCPKCKGNAIREANTLDTFVNSSWYFLRYCDSNNKKDIFKKDNVKYWMPVDLYIGGAEHACMHLIYCRFYAMFLHDLG